MQGRCAAALQLTGLIVSVLCILSLKLYSGSYQSVAKLGSPPGQHDLDILYCGYIRITEKKMKFYQKTDTCTLDRGLEAFLRPCVPRSLPEPLVSGKQAR